MPRHRSLTLEKFVHSISWEYFERYFSKLDAVEYLSGWEFLNADAMKNFLDDPDNAEVAGLILEDFQRINDICENGTSILVRTCQKYGIDVLDKEAPSQISMRLFLDHPEAFEFAWSRFLLYDTSSRLSIYPLPVKGLNITEEGIERLQVGLQEWFSGLAKGDQCLVQHFEDRDETVILIRHGSYIRAFTFWDGDQIRVNSFRPALEDVLVYEPDTSQLRIKAGLPKDRKEYLRLFASCIAGDESIAEQAMKDEMFTLVPLQDGTFSYAGGGSVAKVELVKVRMKLYGVSDPVLELKAHDVQQAFQYDMGSLTMKSGELSLARFRFHLHLPDKRQAPVTFEIEPPSRTDLAQKRHAAVIERYLQEQGVKLR